MKTSLGLKQTGDATLRRSDDKLNSMQRISHEDWRGLIPHPVLNTSNNETLNSLIIDEEVRDVEDQGRINRRSTLSLTSNNHKATSVITDQQVLSMIARSDKAQETFNERARRLVNQAKKRRLDREEKAIEEQR